MRPRLASLALLLLALCRYSSAEDLTPEQKMEVTKKMIGLWEDLFPVFVAVSQFLSPTPVEVEQKKPFYNGLLCAFDENPTFYDTIKHKWEEATGTTVDAATEDIIAASKGIECDTTDDSAKVRPEWKCFCEAPKKTVFYCAALKLKKQLETEGFQKTICPKAALAAVQNAGTKTLQKYLTKETTREQLEAFVSDEPAVATKNEDAEMAKFFCDAADSNVVKAMKTLFHADIRIVTAENIALLQNKEAALAFQTLCSTEELKASPPGQCYCADRKAATFCMWHAQAKRFEQQGYLTCSDAEKKFDKSKRPRALTKEIEIKEAERDAGRHDDPSAATPSSSSLLLAPLSALLLLRH